MTTTSGYNYHLQTKLRKGNVFAGVSPSVILSTMGGRGSHVTITHVHWDMKPTLPPRNRHQTSNMGPAPPRTPDMAYTPSTPTPDMGPTLPPPQHQTWDLCPLLLTSGGHHWKPVQTCSLEALAPSPHWY